MIRPPRARWFRFIASPRVASSLIAAMAGLSLLGILIPQRALLTTDMMTDFENSAPVLARVLDVLGLDALFSGWPVVTIAGLLALSTVTCTWNRIDRYARGISAAPAPVVRRISADTSSHEALHEGIMVSRVRNVMHAAGWATLESPGRVVGVKGRRGFLGSMLLHLSLLIIMVGGSATALSDFSGTLLLAEGQTVIDEPSAYLTVEKVPRLGEAFTGARLTLDSMRFTYQDGQIVEAIATMSGLDTSARRSTFEARVNHPFELAGKSYLVQNSGLVADLTLSTEGRSEGLIVNLADVTPYGWADEIALSSTDASTPSPTTLSLLASPVTLEAGETLPVEQFLIGQPQLSLRAVTGADVGEVQTLTAGSSVEVAPDVVVTFNGVRYWTRFLVRQDTARWVVYLGFWFGVLGIVWRFLMPERRVSMSLIATHGESPYVNLGYRVRPWRGIVWPGDQALLDELAASVNAEETQEDAS